MDMCSGPIFVNLLRFCLPVILTGVLQLLYNAADIVVVGQYAGREALAAVGSTGSLINLLVNVFMGLAVGASVVTARCYGANNLIDVRKAVHTSIAIAAIMGIFVGIFGFFMARPMLAWMDTPADVLDQAALYVQIFFLGMPANMLYNFGGAILRAVGDTKHPLYFLTISGIVNVLLNLLLVIVFHMSVAGVAIATVVSQCISMVLVLRCLMLTDSCIKLELKKLHIYKDKLLEILRVGLPAGLQGSLFSISNVLIQSSVNSFGSVIMAGNAAASNLEGFIYTSMNAIYQGNLTFVSQNMGAKKYDRVNKILWSSLAAVTIIGLGLGLLFLLFSEPLMKIYNTDPQVVQMGQLRLNIICVTYFLCGMMDVMVGQLRGMGYSIMPMIVSLAGACGFRILWILTIFAANHTLEVLYVSYPISWMLTASIHFVCYLIVRRKLGRNDQLPVQ